MDVITVLLIDSHDGVRRVLAQRLDTQPDFCVVGQTASPFAGIEMADRLRPDIIVFDCNTPGAYVAERVRQISRACPTAHVVVFTSYLTPAEEQAYLSAGASAAMLKGLGFSEFCDRLRAITPLASGNGRAPTVTGRRPAQSSPESGAGRPTA